MDVDPVPGQELHSGEPARPRKSASLILLRDSAGGPEVLLVKRSPQQRFMGGVWVFPGGATHGDEGELRTAVRELEEEAGIALAPGQHPVRFSRWITPAQVELRFDTHFFVARAPAGAEPRVDGRECVDARWLRPAEALAASENDDLRLVFPTMKHLEELSRFASVDEVLAAARGRRVLPVEPSVLVQGGVARVVMPGEPGHGE